MFYNNNNIQGENMLSAVTFGSTYKISSKDNSYNKLWQVQNFALENNVKNAQIKTSSGKAKTTSCTIIADDNLDKAIELFCATNGINYKKIPSETLSNLNSIMGRIEPAPKGMTLVMLDFEKLKSLSQQQKSNLAQCEHDYQKYYRDKIDTIMLKSGDMIPATTVKIINNLGSTKELVEQLQKNSISNLRPNQITIDVKPQTDHPDHCICFALYNKGMKNVPVYVNKSTYDIGQALGLFKTSYQ